MDQIGIGKKNMRKLAACKRSELHVRIKKVAVTENREIKDTHAQAAKLRMNVYECAVLHVTAVKPFVSQIEVFESYSGNVQSDNLIVFFYIIIYFIKSFLWFGSVLKTPAWCCSDVSVFVKMCQSLFLAAGIMAKVE